MRKCHGTGEYTGSIIRHSAVMMLLVLVGMFDFTLFQLDIDP